MGDLPHPPKLKLTPRQRAFLAGELYPPEKPYEQPPRLDEETRQRNLQAIKDARDILHGKGPYEAGTEGQDYFGPRKRYDPAKKEWLKKVASSSAPPAPAGCCAALAAACLACSGRGWPHPPRSSAQRPHQRPPPRAVSTRRSSR